jgi:hypothetical protein
MFNDDYTLTLIESYFQNYEGTRFNLPSQLREPRKELREKHPISRSEITNIQEALFLD